MTGALRFLLILSFFVAMPLCSGGQNASVIERLDIQWIFMYEQAYGIAGLYVDEPPSKQASAAVRRDLLVLTRAAREYADQNPDEKITPERLLAMQLLKEPILPPEGTKYEWSPERRRFISSRGGRQDIVAGAAMQIQSAEEYRRRVTNSSALVWQSWMKFANNPQAPDLIRREIETRQFAIRLEDSGPIQAARQTQQQLQRLNDAIEMALAIGKLTPGQEITMEDIGGTGLIDLLPALPLDGKYKVTNAGEKPVAVFGETEVPLDENYVASRLKYEAANAWRARPDYPPALAFAARFLEGEESARMLSRAIELWPDVPALHVQRLAMNALFFNSRALHEETTKDELRGYLDAISRDLDYLMARFPATPILIEVDIAVSKGALAHDMQFRGSIAETMANIRPEVLNAQLMAYFYLIDAGEYQRAQRIYNRLIERHPGYEVLLPNPPAK